MAERWRVMLDLCEQGWASLSEAERALFGDWLRGATPWDLYTLLRYARRMWRRGASASSQTMQSVIDRAEDE